MFQGDILNYFDIQWHNYIMQAAECIGHKGRAMDECPSIYMSLTSEVIRVNKN